MLYCLFKISSHRRRVKP